MIDQKKAQQLLDAAARGRVLVVGDAMLDRYLAGSVGRISPEAPVPVVRVEDERSAPGGAANVAAGVVALGTTCRLVSAVGDDGAAEHLRDHLGRIGIDDADLVVDPGRPTTQKTRVLARHQQMLRIDRESTGGLSEAAARELAARAESALEWADVVVLQDYDKGVFTPGLARSLLSDARARGVPSVVDPKLRHFFDFRGAYLFKPNARELAAACGVEHAPRSEDALRPILTRLDCDHLLLTLGDEGMLLLGRDRTGVHMIPSQAREVFDVTGAGDTVIAVLAAALIGGPPVEDAAALANCAAGIQVSHLGAVPVSRAELLDLLRDI
jgi:D-beta-D-heptose 7-phosphate kinase/D-beta-D-heptose 1-phosphate adenosyltransferase